MVMCKSMVRSTSRVAHMMFATYQALRLQTSPETRTAMW